MGTTIGTDSSRLVTLRGWMRSADWEAVGRHFIAHVPVHAEEFEARAMAVMALRPGQEGARAAVADLRRACSLDRGNVRMAANLMQALIDAGEVAEALTLTADAMRQAPQVLPLAEKRVWALIAATQWAESEQAVQHAIDTSEAAGMTPPSALCWLRDELATGWWRPLCMGATTLRLPARDDYEFVARCFGTQEFIRRYRRFQADDDAAVGAFLDRTHHRPSLTHRIDWIICREGKPAGLASLSDLELRHRRGEFLVGLLEPDARLPTGLQASLAVLAFAFGSLKLRKVTSFVYGDNADAQDNTLHLGFRQEGLLRAHLLTAAGPLDLYANAMLADEWRADTRLQRLTHRWRR